MSRMMSNGTSATPIAAAIKPPMITRKITLTGREPTDHLDVCDAFEGAATVPNDTNVIH